MASAIIYVSEFPGFAAGDNGAVPVVALPPTAQYAVLSTVGGLRTFTITSAGAGFATGSYLNVPVVNKTGTGIGGTLFVVVSAAATGTINALFPTNSGYGYAVGDTFNLVTASLTTAGFPLGTNSIIATLTVLTVVPCGPPFQGSTRVIDVCVDSASPVNVIVGSTQGPSYGGTLTTQLGVLTTNGGRMAVNERQLRGVNSSPVPVLGASGAGFTPTAQLQVIVGTAAA